ncbi:Sterol 3-beta-glucosyltransferase [Taphrina deformans PYCC 5710]|uniref:sterol 3beta-glucosyltransferase n=1 Tax=Taphrina deformans (strain PYCC 5710 / ATCC 11124 / CBS 356.35 / IMI 108563 / JCM 9778 / NBRC 8474) TaxID=1097556 RepID=R4X7F1_TAPDE|nr:Sterol 3-beta-glucosyltransferase [Taphrina deformans PYCC 5710]|eukprot:CCG81279.1 Sterol 3-beta-glucosyltransferase [Taphrina deformans PYCC 5710]
MSASSAQSLGSAIHEYDEPTHNIVSGTLREQSEYDKYQSTSLQRLNTSRSDQESVGVGKHDLRSLSELLQRVFTLDVEDSLISHHPAWLLKSVMLQGHLYIMKHTLCFYAYIPKREDVTVKSGYLMKKSRTTSRVHRHWFILKNNLLSYYNDASDLFYPSGFIDLRQAMTAEADIGTSSSTAFGFKLVTSEQEYSFSTDTASSCNEWIKTLRKVIFRLKNVGDSVKITIPFAAVLDVEESDVLHFTDTMKIRIADDHDTFAINEYLFSLITPSYEIINGVKFQMQANQEQSGPKLAPKHSNMTPVFDTSKAAPLYYHSEVKNDMAAWRARATESEDNIEHFAKEVIDQRGRSRRSLSLVNPFRKTKASTSTASPTRLGDSTDTITPQGEVSKPSGVTKLLDKSLRKVGSIATSAYKVPISAIQYPIHSFLSKKASHDDPAIDEALAGSFRRRFGASDEERLLKAFKPFYVQTVPLIGDLYVSDERVCFHNSTPGMKLRIAIPLKEIQKAQKEKGFSFGFSGLILTIRAHEDMFFEFSQGSDRDQCVDFITGALENMDAITERKHARRVLLEEKAESDRCEHMSLENELADLGTTNITQIASLETAADAPAIMFDSPGASMLAFKPAKQLRFTCLTIGSRGDVQPYVALCKGLIADGQKAKIATHEEFRDFVESHGIEFVPVDGNPAELMAICVEHGMFTYSFLKEASQKFRGWIDELLKSSWKACQNTDVLIESPSAMGGIHIAEALRIPYYRAFTMPWSKTRVYPHAFAVPDHNRGGNYNALTYTAFDHLFWKAISGQVNRWRKKSLNLPSTNFDKLAQHKVPFLYNFSPSVVPPARDWHEWIRVTGYWFLDNPDDKEGHKWEAPSHVTEFIKQTREMKKNLVYIGFGSIVVSDPKALTKAVVEAVHQADVRCILVKGWSARSSQREQEEPDQSENEKTSDSEHEFGKDILSLDSIPHDWLFPQVDAVCHHGGAGSLGASLRAGVPTIVKPFFGDQYFFGSRVHELGVGLCLNTLTANSLADALKVCTSDRLIIEKSNKIGAQISSEKGVDNAIENIYRDLEYAKSLVKKDDTSFGQTSESSGDSYDMVEGGDDIDDEDLYDTRTDANGITSSILKPLKSLKTFSPVIFKARKSSV